MSVAGFQRLFPCFGILTLALVIVVGVGTPSLARDGDSLMFDALQIAQATTEEADEADEGDANDPLESINRIIFEFNEFFIAILLRPASEIYHLLVPSPVRQAIGNVLDNLGAPVVLANDILQGEGERALQTTQRFLVNSTVGVAGIFDVADDFLDIPGHDEDFGQTLAVWGVGEGFYFVVPFFGPSSPRDAVGKLIVDGYIDPVNHWATNADRDYIVHSRMGVGAVDEFGSVMDELDQIKKTSIDYYAAIRSMYRQKRAAEIRNGKEIDLPPIPDLSYELLEQDDGQPAERLEIQPEEAKMPRLEIQSEEAKMPAIPF